ncbi:MAG: hypothetical protein UV61_C0009G0055 [Candidatus Gottesmanbacteria bacterium GW2011_GWB1_43_11]|uniref:Uncharacterized protein n=1 Tax=Candidatus Gottesmanbacteria bacterium GW2011_GWB1_43_11 TaxID=1618446 RepID=A0A0G1FI52_9BACT|nr:MAG: hypothetical protein UV17_C0031G0027 [Candidatus Gottesmanbacteria bacterium GW2011_GWA1_42_26]KKS80895.1 MAG: hypothetical protein UV55_C0026G0005 [Candidatus Gottesmanbacteria bacterium GW2011_GWC1_43_10]KKS86528.1 MAG: hypothetical protein UV61_C0009G0055 [Candidatus Gottesmanbacteria bacterium GW2011_GWB1_43_11]OGG08746.1 MAG: hypothetical protein A2699_06545 [Candidatus Gottesmanbacteria bacterium RIFCSPHIGHO2_01_FULL_43_15]HCM38085.1 hypothetical protein [Patescibacteria group bac
MSKVSWVENFYVWVAMFFGVTAFFHWRLSPNVNTILYLVGGVIGLYLLQIVEGVLKTSPQLLRFIPTQIIVTVLTLFVLTSSTNRLGQGLLLGLNLRLFHWQFLAFQTGSLGDWFRGLSSQLTLPQQKNYLLVLLVLMILEGLIFVAV